MYSILYIGKIDKNNNFTDERWKALIKWLSKVCNNIRIYTRMKAEEIGAFFSEDFDIFE